MLNLLTLICKQSVRLISHQTGQTRDQRQTDVMIDEEEAEVVEVWE